MLGFHRRTRSLIPVKDLGKYDKVEMIEEERGLGDEVDCEMGMEAPAKAHQKQLTLIYIIFLAEA